MHTYTLFMCVYICVCVCTCVLIKHPLVYSPEVGGL